MKKLLLAFLFSLLFFNLSTADELDNHIHALNHVYIPQDVYLMASHPGNDLEPVEFLENTDWESDNEFLMVLIQPFEELEKASSSLNKIGFYEAWPKEYYQSTVTKRKPGWNSDI